MMEAVDYKSGYYDIRFTTDCAGIQVSGKYVDCPMQAAVSAVLFRGENTRTHPLDVINGCDELIKVTYHYLGYAYPHHLKRNSVGAETLKQFRSKIKRNREVE